MSSETDHPRQRTVAELLAAHGDGNVSGGRRRRRREADEPEEEMYAAPDAPSDWRSAPPAAPPPEPRQAAPEAAPPPVQRDTGGRRRSSGDAEWAADQRAPERRAPERRTPPEPQRPPEQRPAAPWGADEPGADDWASEQWDAGQWDDQDRWDTGRRDVAGASGRDPRVAPDQWDAAPVREPRYADPDPREAPPRRARRVADEREAPPQWESHDPAPAWEAQDEPPRRPREREAPAWDPRGAEPEPNGRAPRARDLRSLGRPSWDAPEPEAAPGRGAGAVDEHMPTEQMPHVRRSRPVDPAATSRIQQRMRPEPGPDDLDDDAGPSTMVGAAPVGAEDWHQARVQGRRRPPEPDDDLEPDDGPATMVGAPPAGAEAWHQNRMEGRRRGDDGGPPTQAAAPMSFDDEDDEDDDYYRVDYPAGLDRNGVGEEPTGIFAAGDADDPPVRRRSVQTEEKEQAAGSPAWAAVIAQWIAGAIGGAALWVGFRFLWRDLPVVALAAAVLVTVGLVVVVRALLRSSDLRTTLFAVLVGLLLTVSPAILVLLGR